MKKSRSKRKKVKHPGTTKRVAPDDYKSKWAKRPCNKGKTIVHYLLHRLKGGDCEYVDDVFTGAPSSCPLYDERYCP